MLVRGSNEMVHTTTWNQVWVSGSFGEPSLVMVGEVTVSEPEE